MSRPGDAREALIAEALGDLGHLLDRIEALTPTLDGARDGLERAADKLLGSVKPIQSHMNAVAGKVRSHAVDYIAEKTNAAAKRTLDEQTCAMQESARRIFNEEVVPPLNRVAGELRQANVRASAAWKAWLTHAAVAVTAAACTYAVMTPAIPASAVETRSVASAPSPARAEPALPPEKARVRK